MNNPKDYTHQVALSNKQNALDEKWWRYKTDGTAFCFKCNYDRDGPDNREQWGNPFERVCPQCQWDGKK